MSISGVYDGERWNLRPVLINKKKVNKQKERHT
jgi:hypothetical protein